MSGVYVISTQYPPLRRAFHNTASAQADRLELSSSAFPPHGVYHHLGGRPYISMPYDGRGVQGVIRTLFFPRVGAIDLLQLISSRLQLSPLTESLEFKCIAFLCRPLSSRDQPPQKHGSNNARIMIFCAWAGLIRLAMMEDWDGCIHYIGPGNTGTTLMQGQPGGNPS